jgi:hypothetical protein
MGILLGLGLVALPLSLEGVLACAVIKGYALEMELQVRRLLVPGTPDGSSTLRHKCTYIEISIYTKNNNN